MKTNLVKYSIIPLICLGIAIQASCRKDSAVVDGNYPAQTIYMPTGVAGVYSISVVALPDQPFRYVIDQANKKLLIPLSAYRSGTDNKGNVAVTISSKTDTVNTLIAAGKLAAQMLPADQFTVPGTATISDGSELANFNLSVNLDYLLANSGKIFAIAVTVASPERKASKYATTVIAIDPAFLTPTANFTSAVDAGGVRTYKFTNTSANAISYNWDFGDGTATSTLASPSHSFAASGTYNVKLTAIGPLGDFNKAVKTIAINVP